MTSNLRDQMPTVAKIVTEFREEFSTRDGKVINGYVEGFNDRIRRAIKDGEPTFYASENGVTVGVEIPRDGLVVPVEYQATPMLNVTQNKREKMEYPDTTSGLFNVE